MEKLQHILAAEPAKPKKAWAVEFGISRPHLIALADGTRKPSLPVAQRIEAVTSGAIRIIDWPNLRPIIEAARASQ
jgi:hypothetical protein